MSVCKGSHNALYYCDCDIDNSYSLGFKEGVMWAKAIAFCRKYAYYPSEELSFFVLWDNSIEEGR